MRLADSSLTAQPSVVTPSRYVTIDPFSTVTGLTPAAVRKSIERGVYLEGKQFRCAPDGRIWMDLPGRGDSEARADDIRVIGFALVRFGGRRARRGNACSVSRCRRVLDEARIARRRTPSVMWISCLGYHRACSDEALHVHEARRARPRERHLREPGHRLALARRAQVSAITIGTRR